MITLSRQFATEFEARAWLEERPAPQIAGGPVTAEECARFEETVANYYGKGDSMAAALNGFLARRGVSTEPAEFTDEAVEAAVKAWHHLPQGAVRHVIRMRAALRAAGARP